MSPVPLLGSTLGQIFSPLFQGLAWIIAGFYAVIPNYALAIAFLTLVVMAATAYLTIKSTRSMMAMQRLQPQVKKIQQKYKSDRLKQSEELMELYRQNNVSMAGGLLPSLLQFPIFICLYDLIRGLTNTVEVKVPGGGKITKAAPHYISSGTRLYQDLVAHPGSMPAFGIDLSKRLLSPEASWVGHVPYAILIVLAIGLMYIQMHRMSKRNAGVNSQMQAMQKVMPLIFLVIYINIAAGVNVYFIVSAACRLGLQEYVFWKGIPEASGTSTGPRRRSLMERLAEMQKAAIEQEQARKAALSGDVSSAGAPDRSSSGGSGGQARRGGGSQGRASSRSNGAGTRAGQSGAASGPGGKPGPRSKQVSSAREGAAGTRSQGRSVPGSRGGRPPGRSGEGPAGSKQGRKGG